ncbi:DMT family transporter [Endozoicomonas arenosclerae]|uniref:DMT family transporter n=1 Tax=Endozoicomonas arenosclerae TaxID=1633495 RepID=UPI001561037D|nr:DMT family transporter [Endozoicomonas arenosclerae]
MPTAVLFIVCSFVWGSTWYAITLQLGVVDPLWSVCYRFLLAAFLTALISLILGKFERYSTQQHLRLMLQGACLCGIYYWLIYLSEHHITSALSALISTSELYMMVIFGRIWFGNPVRQQVIAGGLLGSAGVMLIFLPELQGVVGSSTLNGMGLAFSGCVFFSLGSLICEKNERDGMGLLSSAAYTMLYGSLLVAALALVLGISPDFVWSAQYIGSLVYLSIFGSVVAMVSYMALIRAIGADRAAYVDIVYPVIALMISTLFEGYVWAFSAVAGVLMIMFGNYIAMRK